VLSGTILRFVQNTVVVGVTGYFAIRAVKGKTTPYLLIPLIGLILILFLANLPGQIKKEGDRRK
jgi:hypothetical protein